MISSLHVNLSVVFLVITQKKLRKTFKIFPERIGACNSYEKAFGCPHCSGDLDLWQHLKK